MTCTGCGVIGWCTSSLCCSHDCCGSRAGAKTRTLDSVRFFGRDIYACLWGTSTPLLQLCFTAIEPPTPPPTAPAIINTAITATNPKVVLRRPQIVFSAARPGYWRVPGVEKVTQCSPCRLLAACGTSPGAGQGAWESITTKHLVVWWIMGMEKVYWVHVILFISVGAQIGFLCAWKDCASLTSV